MMKMNGMKMRAYWIITILFNFLLSLITFLLFFILGVVLSRLTFFTETNYLLIVFLFN